MVENLVGMKTASWINLVLGAIVFATPFFTVTSNFAFWSAVIVGAVVAVLAIYDIVQESQGQPWNVRGPAIVNVVAGLWLIAAAFFAAASDLYLWLTGLSGLVMVLAAGYNVAAAGRTEPAAEYV